MRVSRLWRTRTPPLFSAAAESGVSDARSAPACHGTTLWSLALGWLHSVTPSSLVVFLS